MIVIIAPENYQQVWHNHVNDVGLLTGYADAMHRLATDVWSKRPDTRIDWCRLVCQEYFKDGGLRKIRDKSQRKRKFEEGKGVSSTDDTISDVPLMLTGSGADFAPPLSEYKVTDAKMDSLNSFFAGMPGACSLFSINKASLVCPSDVAAASMMTTFGSNSSLNMSEFSEVKAVDAMSLDHDVVTRSGTRRDDAEQLAKLPVFGESSVVGEPSAVLDVCSSYGPVKYNVM